MSSAADFLSNTERFVPSKRQAKAIKKKKTVEAECCVCGDKPIIKHKRCAKHLVEYEEFLRRNNAGKQKKAQSGYIYAYDEEGNHGLLHRQTMEKVLGRKLLPHESVVFYDGDRSNCDPSNLVLVLKRGIPLAELVCPCCDTPYLQATIVTGPPLLITSESDQDNPYWLPNPPENQQTPEASSSSTEIPVEPLGEI